MSCCVDSWEDLVVIAAYIHWHAKQEKNEVNLVSALGSSYNFAKAREKLCLHFHNKGVDNLKDHTQIKAMLNLPF